MSALGRVARRVQDHASLVRLAGQVDAGARLPTVALYLLIGLLEVGLAAVTFPLGAGLGIGVPFALVSPLIPAGAGPWVAIAVLGLGQLTRHDALSWHFAVLLAGLHLLHVLGSLALALPWRSRLQPRVLVRPLLRFAAVQVPVQALAILVLALFGPGPHGHRPVSLVAVGLVGAAVVATMAVLLVRPLLEGARDGEPRTHG